MAKALQGKPSQVKTMIVSSNKIETIHVDINKRMRVPKSYLSALFSDLKGIDKKIEDAKAVIDSGKSLTLIGDPGGGKTHLSICLMRYMWAKTQPPLHEAPLFVSIPDLLRTLKSSFSSDTITEEDIIGHYTRPSLVIYDDLGVGNISDWTRDIYYSLIDCRMREEKQTIITTNKSMAQIRDDIDARIASRLCGMGDIMNLGDRDYRMKR